MSLVLPAVLLISTGGAFAQDTLYIGGSGQTSIAIDLGALDRFQAPQNADQGLRHPGVAGGGLAPVILRAPGGTVAKVTARVTAPTPQKTVIIQQPSAAAEVIAPTLDVPEPMPDAVMATAPEDMTAEEHAAAKERNKDAISSTSFADKAALIIDEDEPLAIEAEPEPAPASTSTTTAAPETKVAALGPATAPATPGEKMQIEFGAGESVLPQTAQAPLAILAATLGQDETLRLQLKAYAGGDADSASQARRLSLSRALAVRSELIEQGVRSTRIDVRALGNKSEDGTSDRVDVILVQR